MHNDLFIKLNLYASDLRPNNGVQGDIHIEDGVWRQHFGQGVTEGLIGDIYNGEDLHKNIGRARTGTIDN